MVNSNKICFVVYITDELIYSRCKNSILQLQIPKGFTAELLEIRESANIVDAYNSVISKNDAKYKVYIQQDAFIIDKQLIAKFLGIFRSSDEIGLIGLSGGTISLGRPWQCVQQYGKLRIKNQSEDYIQQFTHSDDLYDIVEFVYEPLMITQYDLPFVENSSRYNINLSFEFCKSNFLVVVPNQENEPWCGVFSKNFLVAPDESYIDDELYDKYQIWRKFYKIKIFYYCLKKLIKSEFDEEEKSKLIGYAARISTLNHIGLYADSFLEQELCEIGKNLTVDFSMMSQKLTKGKVLHVMTAAYETGGHTRVVDKWIKRDKNNVNCVVFTDKNSHVPSWLREGVEASHGEIVFLQAGSLLQKSLELLKLSRSFERIILHIHPYDPVPIIAYANNLLKTPILFFNHSDHTFWLGTSIADLVLEISELGTDVSCSKRKIRKQAMLRIPINININEYVAKEAINYRKAFNLPNEAKVITSMAIDWKFTHFKECNFYQFALDVVNENANTHFFVIGGNPQTKAWQQVIALSDGRVHVTGLLPKDKVAEILSFTDLYIDSFGFGGYTTLLEMLYYGMPVLTKNKTLKIFDPITIGTIEGLKKTINEFVATGKYPYDLKRLKADAEKDYNENEWLKRLNKIYADAEKLTHKVVITDNAPIEMGDSDYMLVKKDQDIVYLCSEDIAKLSFINVMRLRAVLKALFGIEIISNK